MTTRPTPKELAEIRELAADEDYARWIASRTGDDGEMLIEVARHRRALLAEVDALAAERNQAQHLVALLDNVGVATAAEFAALRAELDGLTADRDAHRAVAVSLQSLVGALTVERDALTAHLAKARSLAKRLQEPTPASAGVSSWSDEECELLGELCDVLGVEEEA